MNNPNNEDRLAILRQKSGSIGTMGNCSFVKSQSYSFPAKERKIKIGFMPTFRAHEIIDELKKMGVEPDSTLDEEESIARERIFARAGKEFVSVLVDDSNRRQTHQPFFPEDHMVSRDSQGRPIGFPNPRNSTVNNPAYILRKESLDDLYRLRTWPTKKQEEALSAELEDPLELIDWAMLVAYLTGWSEGEFIGGQLLLRANIRINTEARMAIHNE
ncbi:MAG TPA: hypothetical protein VN081_01260 [Dongiaceae bacterium]|nr:hypothetical protein [Dongiaceae bacterium]